MSAEPLALELQRLEERLLELVSCLECDPLPGERVLDASWGAVHRAFASVRARLEGVAEAAEEHVEPLERCQRLHVLATGLLTRRRDELVAEREAFRRLRERLAGVRRDVARGDACDVSA